MPISNQECILPCKCCSLMKDVLCLLHMTEKGSSLSVETKVAWDGDNWFCKRSSHAPGSQFAPSRHSFRSGSSLLFLTGFSCVSLCGWTRSQHSWTPRTSPPFLGKETEGQCAPRMYLHCSCIFSWHSGSSELRGQMQLLVGCTETCAFTRKVCCPWLAGLCFLDCLKNSFLL